MEEIFYSSTYSRSMSKTHMYLWHIIESSYIHSLAFAKECFSLISVKKDTWSDSGAGITVAFQHHLTVETYF